MEQGVMDSPVVLVIKAPDQKYDDQTISCFLNWTVEKLKSHLSNVYPSKPRFKDQRLVYSGKLLQDHCKLRDVLRKQDEFHMLHLVCASRSPPPSPSMRRRNGGSSQAVSSNRNPAALRDDVQSDSSEQTPDRSSYLHPSAHGSAWTRWLNQQQHSSQTPHYPMYNPHTLLWWQQLYTWQCHMTYRTWMASVSPPPQSVTPPVPPIREAQADAPNDPGNVRVGAGLNEENLNRDWLDWVYAASRALVLLSLVYFYSSFSRFVMVTGAMLLLYLHQAGWLPFNLDNELQDLAEPANHNQDEANANDRNNTDQQADEGEDEEEQREGPDGDGDDDFDDDGGGGGDDDDVDGWVNLGFLSSTWSFITTFFASLIPEAVPNAVN